MKIPGNKGLWLRIAGSLLTVGLLVWLLANEGWDKIAGAFLQIPAWQLAAAMLLTLVSRVAVAMRWHMLLRAADPGTKVGQTLRVNFAGLFASNYLPTTIGGDVVRLAGAVQLGLDGAVVAATLVVDRLVGMAGMAVLLPWGIVPLWNSGLQLGTGMAGIVARREQVAKLRTFALRLWKKFAEALLAGVRQPKALAAAFGFTMIHGVCTFTSMWLMFSGMGQPIDWMRVAGIWSLVYFVTLLPVSINGYGLQEVMVTLLYTQLGGISSEASVTIALVIRTMQMIASLPGALFVPGILSRK